MATTQKAKLNTVSKRGSDLRSSHRSNDLRNTSILVDSKSQQGLKPEADRIA